MASSTQPLTVNTHDNSTANITINIYNFHAPPSPGGPPHLVRAYAASHPEWLQERKRRWQEANVEEDDDDEEDGDEDADEYNVGIYQVKTTGKWRGKVSDIVYSVTHPGVKKTRSTPCFVSKQLAIQERAKLYKQVHDEYDAIVMERVRADPLTRDLEKGPDDVSTANPRKAYWVCSGHTNYYPTRMVAIKGGRQKFKWQKACIKCDIDNASAANAESNNVSPIPVCNAHGARCKHENPTHTCMTCNIGKKRMHFCSADCGVMIDAKRRISKGGSGFCSSCDPVEKAKRQKAGNEIFVSKEQFFAIENERHFPELEAESVDGVVCDSTIGTGASRRRTDLATCLVDPRSSTEFVQIDECDEAPHLRGGKCYDRDGVLGKLSGHFSDLGAPSIPKEEADQLDSTPLTDEERSGKIQNAKTRLLQRITNKVLTEQKATMCPVRILSVGVDAYTDSNGKKHPSAFIEYTNENGDKRLKTRPEEWEKRIKCFVREKKKLLRLGAEGPTVVHVRLFYNGCDSESGLDL